MSVATFGAETGFSTIEPALGDPALAEKFREPVRVLGDIISEDDFIGGLSEVAIELLGEPYEISGAEDFLGEPEKIDNATFLNISSEEEFVLSSLGLSKTVFLR